MILNSPFISGSLTVTGNTIISGSITAPAGIAGTASYASNAELLDGLDSTSFAKTGSNAFSGSQTITGSLTATGTIVAQTLVVQTITSSVDFVSGSTRFGSTTGNTHQFTGSVLVSGSQIISGTAHASKSFADTSNMQIIAEGNIAGINIRSSQGGRFSIAEGYIAPNITSFYTSTGTSNPSVEAIRISNDTGAATFSSTINTGGDVDISTGAYRSQGEIVIRRSGNEIRMGSGGASDYLVYYAGASERMRVHTDGKISIGTSSAPYGNFVIKSNNTTAYMGLNVYANGNSNFTYVNHNNNVGIIGTEFGTGGTGHTPLTFQAGGAERLRIGTDGRLSITMDQSVNNQFLNFVGTQASFNQEYGFGIVNGTKDFRFYDYTSGNERLRITNAGDIIFGVTPSYDTTLYWKGSFTGTTYAKVWADGNPRFNVQVNGSGGVYVAAGGTSWTAASDERLKTDLSPIENGIDKVNQLRSVTGRYLTDDETKSRSFLIAQDVHSVLPEAVDIDAITGIMGVQYTEVIPLLVAAIKELSTKNDALEARLAALETA